MLVLGVESSCDETALALVEDGRVLSSVIRTQVERHAPFGGVVPDIAARCHSEAIAAVAQEAFARAERSPEEVDAVAATCSPGLVGCLVVGLAWARGFAVARALPFVAIDHLEAHVYACLMPEPGAAPASGAPASPQGVELPLVALLVSGGHTAIYRYGGPGELSRRARTVDDAAGEAFDKVAVMLGLGYPGGPEIERAAREGDPKAYAFPRIRVKRSRLDFSFSGLKTAVLYKTRGQDRKRSAPLLPEISVPDVAASFQEAVCDVLVKRTLLVAQEEGVSGVALAGGVANNGRLRELLSQRAQRQGLEVHLAPRAYCADNAAMVAGLAWAQLALGLAPREGDLSEPASSRSAAS